MRLVLEPIPALPRLAWCARIRTGTDEVVVRHGQGTWGLRGTIRVRYPDRGVYIRNQ